MGKKVFIQYRFLVAFFSNLTHKKADNNAKKKNEEQSNELKYAKYLKD